MIPGFADKRPGEGNPQRHGSMSYQVIDPAGRLLNVADDAPVPPGCTLRVPTQFLDHQSR
jgi:hypothetical protein